MKLLSYQLVYGLFKTAGWLAQLVYKALVYHAQGLGSNPAGRINIHTCMQGLKIIEKVLHLF